MTEGMETHSLTCASAVNAKKTWYKREVVHHNIIMSTKSEGMYRISGAGITHQIKATSFTEHDDFCSAWIVGRSIARRAALLAAPVLSTYRRCCFEEHVASLRIPRSMHVFQRFFCELTLIRSTFCASRLFASVSLTSSHRCSSCCPASTTTGSSSFVPAGTNSTRRSPDLVDANRLLFWCWLLSLLLP